MKSKSPVSAIAALFFGILIIVASQDSLSTILCDKDLADVYDRNLERAIKATALISAPVAAEKAKLIPPLGTLGKISAKKLLLGAEAFTGGFAIGSALGGLFADPLVSVNEFWGAIGLTDEEILSFSNIRSEPFLGVIPVLVESGLPMVTLITEIPRTEQERRIAQRDGDLNEQARLEIFIEQQLQQLDTAMQNMVAALTEMQAQVSTFLLSYSNAMSVTAIQALQRDMVTEGFPQEEVDAMQLFGFTNQQVSQLADSVAALDASSIQVSSVFDDLKTSASDLAPALRTACAGGQGYVECKIPEPNTWSLAMMGLIMLFIRKQATG